MSVHALLERASALLESTTVEVDDFFKCLADFFGYDSPEKITEKDLKFAKWEDLEECGLPKGKARQVADVFRSESEPEESATQVAPLPGSPIVVISDDPEAKAKNMTPRQLVETADLSKKTDVYAQRLNELAEGRKFVVYNSDNSKNVEKTIELFDQLEDHGERDTVTVKTGEVSSPHRVYYVFDKPAKTLNEHPLHEGRALRPDDRWNEVELRVRQLLRVAIAHSGELGLEDYHEVDLVEDAITRGFEYLAGKYPNAAIKLQDLESTGKAPTLKIKVSKNRAKAGAVTDGEGNEIANDPFGTNRAT